MTRTLQHQRESRIAKAAFQTKTIKRELAINRVTEFTVELSYPASELMQNRSAGQHWSFSHAAKVAQKDEAYLLTRQAIVSSGFEAKDGATYRIEMEFCPPDKRVRDVSNLHAAMKAALDGIAKAMGVDDKTFKQHTQTEGQVHVRGRVIVKVSEIR
jgi:crossover junction endodeoxyribonuclease RusA